MQAIHHRDNPESSQAFPLSRRGIAPGWVSPSTTLTPPPVTEARCRRQWQQLQAVPLPAILRSRLSAWQPQIDAAFARMAAIVEGESIAGDSPSHSLLPHDDGHEGLHFALTAISAEEHDRQAIEKLYFQGYDGDQPCGDEVWCKLSWLSFAAEDASLRFRFSFGTEGVEAVAANPAQQRLAAELCQHAFPESAIVSDNPALAALLRQVLQVEEVAFVERIVYFNAPDGGALFHHDVEPGHAGVIYAQLSGTTFWLALSKQQLMAEIRDFTRHYGVALPCDDLAAALNDPDHAELEAIIDHDPRFIHQLTERGYGYILQPGDAMLLPQPDEARCLWHSVFCLGDEPGEGLSFAMREAVPA